MSLAALVQRGDCRVTHGGSGVADLESLIVDTVAALLGHDDGFDLSLWRKGGTERQVVPSDLFK